jgi:hypothetical protein
VFDGLRAAASSHAVSIDVILSDISVIGPEYTPPKPPQPPPPAQPWLRQCDHQLLEHLRNAACPVWSLLNIVADAQGPRDRMAGRLLRLELLSRLKRLRRLGLAFPVGRNWISASKPDPAARRPAVRRRRRTVRELSSIRAVSADTGSGPQQTGKQPHPVRHELVKRRPAPCPPKIETEKTESGNAPERISEAARQLAKLPRNQPRKLTGWIGDRRGFLDLPVLLPNGRQAWVFGAQRNKVVVTYDKGRLLGTLTPQQRWGVLPASKVQIVKNEHAVILGKRKAGTKEVFSLRKQEAARANGRQPPGPGRQPRGRPRRVQPQATGIAQP